MRRLPFRVKRQLGNRMPRRFCHAVIPASQTNGTDRLKALWAQRRGCPKNLNSTHIKIGSGESDKRITASEAVVKTAWCGAFLKPFVRARNKTVKSAYNKRGLLGSWLFRICLRLGKIRISCGQYIRIRFFLTKNVSYIRIKDHTFEISQTYPSGKYSW